LPYERKKKASEEEKAKRLQDWEEGGLKAGEVEKKSPHELILDKHNQDFVNYYQGLKILDEKEWDAFYAKLKEPLDICFRINSVE
jgi:hypothetical protein